MAYLDDIVIYLKSLEEHVMHLRLVFKKKIEGICNLCKDGKV